MVDCVGGASATLSSHLFDSILLQTVTVSIAFV